MEWEGRVRKNARRAVCREEILSLLKVVVSNPGLGCSNVLLVYDKAPDAALSVAGAHGKGWGGQFGRMRMVLC